ncbi:hypothetical protein D3C86_1775050 [compost metagenome]
MWNMAKLARGAKAPMTMPPPSSRTALITGAGWSSRVSNAAWKAGVTTMRRRANRATTLMAKATKKG